MLRADEPSYARCTASEIVALSSCVGPARTSRAHILLFMAIGVAGTVGPSTLTSCGRHSLPMGRCDMRNRSIQQLCKIAGVNLAASRWTGSPAPQVTVNELDKRITAKEYPELLREIRRAIRSYYRRRRID